MASTPAPAFYLDCVNDYGTRRLVAHAVQLTDGGVRTPTYRYSDPGSELTHLQVSAYLTPDQPHAWGYTCRYRDLVSVDLDHARAMARTLGRIQRGLARLRDQLGPAEDFHTYLLHVGSTLDIRHYLLRLAEHGTDGKRYRQLAPLAVGEWISRQEQRYAAPAAGWQPNPAKVARTGRDAATDPAT
jgi:hypothetical protein